MNTKIALINAAASVWVVADTVEEAQCGIVKIGMRGLEWHLVSKREYESGEFSQMGAHYEAIRFRPGDLEGGKIPSDYETIGYWIAYDPNEGVE